MAPDRVKHHLRTPPKRHIVMQGPYKRDNIKVVDGLAHGQRFQCNYSLMSSSPPSVEPAEPDLKRPVQSRPQRLALGDLKCVRVLGQGEYGKVLLVRTNRKSHKHDLPRSYFALKAFEKKHIHAVEDTAYGEKDVERKFLKKISWNPFVNGLVDVFYDDRNIYMMLEFIPCGTLRSIINEQAPLDATKATFYFSNITCGLAFLEQYGIVHRDLKPENILLGADGYLVLSDFGTAVVPSDVTSMSDWAMVGSPRYMAPECINPMLIGSVSYGPTVDWWASGCIFFELLTGESTFSSTDGSTEATLKKILLGRVVWPQNVQITTDLKSLVESFLVMDTFKRLGFNGCEEIFDHDYFTKIDWFKVENKLYMAPHMPPLPRVADQWHKCPLPRQAQTPGLEIIDPPLHMTHDSRFSIR
ncbi:hypothetical protein APHAL10511_001075 [Amanita phalloides]|nr:hypothetical protein APHAL10511_001075 [Amanita phalloides]